MEQILPCPRCGSPRKIAKTWDEEIETTIGTSIIKHTLMICPDEECQVKVDGDVAKQELKREAAIQAKEQRMQRAYNHSHTKKETEAE